MTMTVMFNNVIHMIYYKQEKYVPHQYRSLMKVKTILVEVWGIYTVLANMSISHDEPNQRIAIVMHLQKI